ncbi:bifunctional pyr operon transcriptional regulator/uracil phosphoribosyltransferase PyrR [Deferrisoma camini]|uniref:bifunctional pyr operon transcriptional regulator/uracil phosphoribosyltransferase PyrR n=1 Tax=Deferrisoma camini TaxID=1035120 RepID=UPI00046D8083|nr:bifunctional pyr operon transcriptional regulator/uracil phosphoribosyltransferase PyrR [Deferrisoma camini]
MAETYRRVLLNADAVRRSLARMALEILERNRGTQGLALVGIVRRGDRLARRIADHIRKAEGVEVPVGRLDITLYRDDLGRKGAPPPLGPTDIPFSLDDRVVVLVDDVLYTGRTVRAALDALVDLGRPRAIQLAVLVDRGHRELPIQPDYVGHAEPTRPEEEIEVRVGDDPSDDAVFLVEPGWDEGEV